MAAYNAFSKLESNARTYAASFKKVFQIGDGCKIFDEGGQEFLDCLACAGSLPLGHNHPEVKAAVIDFLSSNHVQQVLDLSTPAKIDFTLDLFSFLPPAFASNAKIQFCSPSGSDAVEAAIKLCRFATQRHPIIAFQGAYHGMTGNALSAMGNLGPKSGIGSSFAAVHFAPYPYSYRCPFGTNGAETDAVSLHYLRTMLTDPESGIPKPAAVILEVVQGEGGAIPASDAWLRGVRELTYELDIPLILDEVQTGFGRTGHMFAFESAGIMPDVLVLSKAVGGGYPLAVILYNQSLDLWPRGMHAGTFRGNQIAMVAGRATMNILKRDRLDLHAAKMGQRLKDGLRNIASRYPCLGDIRGRGLMIGVEVIDTSVDVSAKVSNGALAEEIKMAAFSNGLILEAGGRHGAVLRFLPPLIIQECDIERLLLKFEIAVDQATQKMNASPLINIIKVK